MCVCVCVCVCVYCFLAVCPDVMDGKETKNKGKVRVKFKLIFKIFSIHCTDTPIRVDMLEAGKMGKRKDLTAKL